MNTGKKRAGQLEHGMKPNINVWISGLLGFLQNPGAVFHFLLKWKENGVLSLADSVLKLLCTCKGAFVMSFKVID